MSTFDSLVYNACTKIPEGKVTTYKYIAEYINHPRAYRAVGKSLSKNPNAPSIPCHRVIASNGKLTGYKGSADVTVKRELLEKEGIEIKNDRVNKRYIVRI